MKSINNILSIEEQIEKLKKLGLKFVDEDSTKKFGVYLTQYNYEVIINGYWFDHFYQEDKKKFSENISSNDIRYIFDIDRTISSIIWKYFKGLELYFNSIITNALCKAFEENLDGPYASLLDEKSVKKIFKYHKKNSYMYLKKWLLENASCEKWFKDLQIQNRKYENKKIIEKIDLFLKLEKKHMNKKNIKVYYHDYSLIHLKALSSSWAFSKVKKIYEWLNDDIKKTIIKDFFDYLGIKNSNDLKNEKIAFMNLLEFFSDFRNALAHNTKIIDWKIKIDS
ncbi:MAG: Abi family protein, partial [Mycoplasmoidaceae bacterium]